MGHHSRHAPAAVAGAAWLPGSGGGDRAALLLRVALDSVLPPGFPYLTFFPAFILTAFFFGLRPGIICAGLSGLAAWYIVIPPFFSFDLSPPTTIALAR